MGGVVSSLFGGESSEQKAAKRASQAAEATAAKNAKAREVADAARAKKLAQQKSEAAIVAQSKTKRRVAGNRNIFTSPLGLENDTLA